jgi:hypothetical protein
MKKMILIDQNTFQRYEDISVPMLSLTDLKYL